MGASTQYMKRIEKEVKELKVQKLIVYPKQADVWLKKNMKNRKVSMRIVRKWQDSLEREEWALNGETVKIDARGNLIDGQHRLMAISESGIPAPLLVVMGLPIIAFNTVDIGKARKNLDVLTSNGIEGSNYVVGALSWIKKLTTVTGLEKHSSDLTPLTIMDYYSTHNGVAKYGSWANPLGRRRFAEGSALMALAYLFNKKDAKLCSKFRAGLESGFGKNELWHRMVILLKRSHQEEAGHRFGAKRKRVAIIINTWNAYRDGQHNKINSVNFDWATQDWPKIQ